MLYLHQSNQLELLVKALGVVLKNDPPSPLRAETIVIPHQGMGRWLNLQLADQLGISANIEMPLPAGFIWHTFRSLFDTLPEQDRFNSSVMVWKILDGLEALKNDPRFEPVSAYLADDIPQKRWQLASRLATCFDRYLVYRPEWIDAWEAGEPAIEGDAWQSELWRRMSDQNDAHWVRLGQQFYDLDQLSDQQQSQLSHRVTLFGLPTLSPGYLKIVQHLSRFIDVRLFLLNPCEEYWADIVDQLQKERQSVEADGTELYLEVGNPLLASLGRQGRDLFGVLLQEESDCNEEFTPASGETVLGRLQNDILQLRDATQHDRLPFPDNDHSLLIHACHSPMREVEVLYDQLLERFDSDPALQPSDVLVVMTDMEQYAPAIEAVFGEPGDRPAIPWNLSDRGLAADSPLVEAFFCLLELVASRFELDRMVDLLEVPAVANRFNIPQQDLPQVIRWLVDSGIRWGRDAAFRSTRDLPEEAQNSWQSGLDRLLLGYAMPGGEQQMFGGILPFDNIEGGGAALLGGVIDFAEALFELEARLQPSRTATEWVAFFNRLLDRFFAPEEQDVDQLQLIRDGLVTLLEQTQLADYTTSLAFELIKHPLRAQLQADSTGGRFLGGGVTFCALTPMRALPFKVICLLGMNDGVFPRDDRPASFDLMAGQFRCGDRTHRSDDRYLFLETLISARETLYISYTGQDIRDNSSRPPSVLVDELLDYLQASYPDEHIDQRLITRHPLQSFSADYFSGQAGLFSYSKTLRDAGEASRLAEQLSDGAIAPLPFLSSPLPPPDELEWRSVELSQLCAFYKHPVRYFLQKRLRIFFREADESLDSREPMEYEFFDSLALDQRLLEAKLADKTTPSDQLDEQLLALERARGTLPHGNWGKSLLAEHLSAAEKLAEQIRSAKLDDPLDPSPALHLQHGLLTLDGLLSEIRPQGAIHYSTRKPWDGEKIDLWINHLALNLVRPDGVEPVTEWRYPAGVMRFTPVDNAEHCLKTLLDIYWQGLSQPLHLFPKSSLTFALAEHDDQQNQGAEVWIKRAEGRWFDSYNRSGEGSDDFYQLAFRGSDVFDEAFVELCNSVYKPLVNHLEEK